MASGNQPPYTVTRDTDGHVDEIRDSDGLGVPKDPHDQRYCDFLTWASHNQWEIDHKQFPLYKEQTFFSSRDRLVEHCRNCGITLATDEGFLADCDRRLVTKGPWFDSHHTENFYTVFRASAGPSSNNSFDGTVAGDSGIWVTSQLIDDLGRELCVDDSDIRRLSAWPVPRSFVTLDISDFSEYPAGQQLLIIKSLIQLVGTRRYWDIGRAAHLHHGYEEALCIGDGYVYVFTSVLDSTVFAAHLAKLIEVIGAKGRLPVPFHFRIGLHFGEVYSFWDPGRKGWNYSGSGINGSRRVLEAIGKDRDDMIFMSGEFKDELVRTNDATSTFRAILGTLQNRGRHRDKHGNPWRVYELNQSAVAILPGDLQQ